MSDQSDVKLALPTMGRNNSGAGNLEKGGTVDVVASAPGVVPVAATLPSTALPVPAVDRDRYAEATSDFASHIGDKILSVLRHPDNQSRLQSVLDPIVSHIIQRVFPYILLSAILFLILFILTIGTFWILVRSGLPATQGYVLTAVATQ
jgi:hypothetical protein